jgi:hypothetical protein
MLLLPCPQFPQVELHSQTSSIPIDACTTPKSKFETHLEFFTFKDISICPADLSRSARDRSIKAACSELRFKERINLGV